MAGRGWKECWMNYVKQQSEKTARDPNAKAKLIGCVIVLLIISYNIPKAESSLIGCAPCVTWAATFCTKAIATGGVCASVALFPPLLCACLIAAGGFVCAGAAVTCAIVCAVPTP